MPSLGALTTLTPKTVTATFDFGGDEPTTVTYRPHQIVVVEKTIEELPDDDTAETRNLLAVQLAAVVVGWDIKGPVPDEDLIGIQSAKAGSVVADGETIPIDKDVLTWFPVPTLKGLLAAIVEDSGSYPKKTQNGSRPSGSIPTSASSK